jgi:hypothetical protein
MQCASSTATSGTWTSRSRVRKPGNASRSGATYTRHASPQLGCLERGRQERHRHAAPLERLRLVVHQRDERRDDNGRSRQQRCRELVGEALPAARRGNEQQAAGVEERVNRLALPGTKRGVAKPRERGIQVHWNH